VKKKRSGIMKHLIVIMLAAASLFGSSVSCGRDHSAMVSHTNTDNKDSISDGNPKDAKMKIKIGSKTFNATLFGNATAAAFKAMQFFALPRSNTGTAHLRQAE
jgi:hypothetical protein